MMKKLIAVALLGLTLSGCTFFTKVEGLYEEVSGATISPQQVYVAVNAYDAAVASAAAYFTYCRPYVNLSTHKALASAPSACSDANRRLVFRGKKAGDAARRQLETYLIAGTAAPRQIYDTLSAVITSLQNSAVGAAR
jgi:hypothetical protein